MKGSKSLMKKLISFILKTLIIIIVTLFIVVGLENKLNLDVRGYFHFFNTDEYVSKYIYVYDRENENAVYEKNSNKRTYPASLTKIMTTIVALENINDLSAITPVDVESYHKMIDRNASMAGFYGKETVTYRDLLYGTILSSGGEAANSLAIHVAGNVEKFVQMMNDKANEIGLNDTYFTNPEGLHDKNQYTTASDMAKLLDYALNNGHFKAIFTKETFLTTSTADHPDGILLNSTVLSHLNKEDQNGFEIIGGKSGTTYEAGQCWATLALINNNEYINIVMGAPLKDISNPDKSQMDDTLILYEKLYLEKY